MATRIGILGVLYIFVVLNVVVYSDPDTDAAFSNGLATGVGLGVKRAGFLTSQTDGAGGVAPTARFRQRMQTKVGAGYDLSLAVHSYARGRVQATSGIDFLGVGYDLAKGNPDGNGETILDPGYRASVVQVEVSQGRYTPSYHFMPKNGFSLPEDACEQASKAETIKSSDDYKSSLQVDVSVSGKGTFSPLVSAEFSASAGYAGFQKNVVNTESVRYDMKSYCLTNHMGFFDDMTPPPTQEFSEYTNKLPLAVTPEETKCLETVSPVSGETVECVHLYNQKYQSYIYAKDDGTLALVSDEDVKTEKSLDKVLWQYDEQGKTLRHHKTQKYLVLLKNSVGLDHKDGKMGKAATAETVGGDNQMVGGWIPIGSRHWVFDPVIDADQLQRPAAGAEGQTAAGAEGQSVVMLLEEATHGQKSKAQHAQAHAKAGARGLSSSSTFDEDAEKSVMYKLKDLMESDHSGIPTWLRLTSAGWLIVTTKEHEATMFFDDEDKTSGKINVGTGKYEGDALGASYFGGVGAYSGSDWTKFEWQEKAGANSDHGQAFSLVSKQGYTSDEPLTLQNDNKKFWCHRASGYSETKLVKVFQEDAPPTPASKTSAAPKPDRIFLRFEMKAGAAGKMAFVGGGVGWYVKAGTRAERTMTDGKVDSQFVTDPAHENVDELVMYHVPDVVKDPWFQLFKEFGTHWVDDLHAGGKMVVSVVISQSDVTEAQEKGVNVAAMVGGSYSMFSGKASGASKSKQESINSELNLKKTTTISLLGGTPPVSALDSSTAFKEWAGSIGEATNTMPVRILLRELPDALRACKNGTKFSPLGVEYTCKPMDKRSYDKMSLLYSLEVGVDAKRSLLTLNSEAVLNKLKPGWSISSDGPVNFIRSKDKAVKLKVLESGELEVVDSLSRVLWGSHTGGKGVGPYTLELREDMNVALSDMNDLVIWETDTCQSLCGGKAPKEFGFVYGIDGMATGNLVLTNTLDEVVWETRSTISDSKTTGNTGNDQVMAKAAKWVPHKAEAFYWGSGFNRCLYETLFDYIKKNWWTVDYYKVDNVKGSGEGWKWFQQETGNTDAMRKFASSNAGTTSTHPITGLGQCETPAHGDTFCGPGCKSEQFENGLIKSMKTVGSLYLGGALGGGTGVIVAAAAGGFDVVDNNDVDDSNS